MTTHAASPAAHRPSPATRTHRDFLAIPDFTRDELESLFVLAERMRNGEYTRRPLEGKTLAMPIPRVGDAAPNFTALDDAERRISLSDFRGKVVVLYFYPKDDTPG